MPTVLARASQLADLCGPSAGEDIGLTEFHDDDMAGQDAVFLPAVLHQCVRMDKDEHPNRLPFWHPGAFNYFRLPIFSIVVTVHLSLPDHQA